MTLKELGYNQALEDYRNDHKLNDILVGRVISELKDRYTVKTESKEFDAELIGNLRFSATDRSDFPVAGDWVSIFEYDEGKALINSIFPRSSIIERKAVGKLGQTQIISTNIILGLNIPDYYYNQYIKYQITKSNTVKS